MEAADADVGHAATAQQQQSWVQLLDESSNTFYYANVVTHETSWDAPALFIKHEDIQTSFEPLDDAPEHERAREHADPIHCTNDDDTGAHGQEPSLELSVSPAVSEALPHAQVIPPLAPRALLPERSRASPEKLKKCGDGADAASIESHPLFAFAIQHYNLEAPSKTLLFGLRSKTPQRFDLRTRLYWESGLIAASITQLPKAQMKVALQAFRNISGFMGNRSSGKGQIDHCFKLLRTIATKSLGLKDEVYCQLCKQLTGNPDVNAVLNGWLLLNACLTTFPASAELSPFLERFFAQHMGATEPEIAQFATDALHALQNCFKHGDRKELPSLLEIQALRDHSPLEVAVALLDGSVVKAGASAWTTCRELSRIVADKLGVCKTQAFALFESSSSLGERVLEPDERVLDLYALWERIGIEKEPKATKKQKSKASKTQAPPRHSISTSSSVGNSSAHPYALVYKVYLWIDFDDELAEEIGMLYMQAVHSVVSGAYACSLDKCVELASYQLYCSRYGAAECTDPRLELLRTLEQFVPSNVLSPANRLRVCDEILTAHAARRDTSLRECKLAYLRVCRSLRFYGATLFAVRNTRDPRLPSELVLAVSAKGLSLVSVANEAALAQFRYVDIASWGYSASAFVFVVAQTDDETEHVLKTTAGKHINDVVAAYVKYIVTLSASD